MERSEAAFRIVCLLFSVVLFALTLMNAVQLAEVNDRAVQLEQETSELREENRRLRIRWESSVSLEEIERYAQEELGMQHCAPGQVIVVEMKEG